MAEPRTATAHVTTAAPARYAKQLVSHLGRRCEVVEEDGGTRLVLDVGSCLLVAVDDRLELHATAGTGEGLERVRHVVGSHLERFGQREDLVVRWEQEAGPTAGAPDRRTSSPDPGGA